MVWHIWRPFADKGIQRGDKDKTADLTAEQKKLSKVYFQSSMEIDAETTELSAVSDALSMHLLFYWGGPSILCRDLLQWSLSSVHFVF
jgi:hypothetical protein